MEQELGLLVFVFIVAIDHQFAVSPATAHLFTDILGLRRTPKFRNVIGFDITEFLHEKAQINISQGVHIDGLVGNVAAFRLNKMIRAFKVVFERL